MDNNINYIDVFKALSDPIRLDLLKKISSCDCMCVCELTDSFELSQSKLSYHLKLLLVSNLITREARGKWNFYSINMNQLKLVLSDESINSILK